MSESTASPGRASVKRQDAVTPSQARRGERPKVEQTLHRREPLHPWWWRCLLPLSDSARWRPARVNQARSFQRWRELCPDTGGKANQVERIKYVYRKAIMRVFKGVAREGWRTAYDNGYDAATDAWLA